MNNTSVVILAPKSLEIFPLGKILELELLGQRDMCVNIWKMLSGCLLRERHLLVLFTLTSGFWLQWSRSDSHITVWFLEPTRRQAFLFGPQFYWASLIALIVACQPETLTCSVQHGIEKKGKIISLDFFGQNYQHIKHKKEQSTALVVK